MAQVARMRYLHPDFVQHVLPDLSHSASTYQKDEDKDANMTRMTAGKHKSLQKYWSHLLEEVSTKDIRILMRDGAEVRLRIYTPTKETALAAKRPVLYSLHGGGFVAGSLETEDLINRQLCSACDTVVFSLEYRLAPNVKVVPTIIEDCEDGLKWTYANASKYGGDVTNSIFLCGTSSGGFLVTTLAFRSKRLGIPVKGTISRQPAYILCDYKYLPELNPEFVPLLTSVKENYDAPGLSGTKLKELIDRIDLKWETHRNSNDFPLFATKEELSQMPPMYFVMAECDPLVDEVFLMKDRLVEAGVSVRFTQYPGMPHGFHAYHVLRSARDEMKDTADALKFLIQKSQNS